MQDQGKSSDSRRQWPVLKKNSIQNAVLNCSEVLIDRESDDELNWETIQLSGTINVYSGTINSPNSNTICSYSESDVINIYGGTISSFGKYDAIYNLGTLIIEEGNISTTSGRTIYNDSTGTVTIKGGNISSTSKIAIYTKGTVTINGGTISTTSRVAG